MRAEAIALSSLGKWVRVGFWGRKKTLLDQVSLRVVAGTTVGFVGPNGAGKSTTLKHVIGASRPSSGTVRIFGADPADPTVRSRFGYMPELPSLPPTLSPLEMMRLHARLYGVREERRVWELLELVDLRSAAKSHVGTFSKGMQTRLILALALLHRPELLILDEPMSGLDPLGRQLVRNILRDERERGRTIFFSSHVLADVEALCDEVAVMNGGRLVYAGPTRGATGDVGVSWAVRVRPPEGRPVPTIAGVKASRTEGDTVVVVLERRDGIDAAVELRAGGCVILGVDPVRPTLEDRLVALLGPPSHGGEA